MTDYYDPPTLSQAFEARDQTQPSTWSSRPNESYRPKPSAKIRGLIGRLGLRYHPANQADLSSHQAMLVLLAEDLAHIDPAVLDRAIAKHVVVSPFMPKAADLIRIAQSLEEPATSLDAYCNKLNEDKFSGTMGWLWMVHTGENGVRYLDRHDAQRAFDVWKPDERELQITQDVIAEYLADPSITQEMFNHASRSGTISRAVSARMAAHSA